MATGAKGVTRAEAPRIYNLLENLCISRGLAVPALLAAGADVLRPALREALEPCRDGHGGYRLRSDHRFVVAHRPAPAP